MKSGKTYLKTTVMHVCFLFLFFIANASFAQNGVKKDDKKSENETLSQPTEKLVIEEPKPDVAPVLVKQFGEYKVMLEDGIKVVYDAKGIPQMLNADDFERIYFEKEAKKKAETQKQPTDKK